MSALALRARSAFVALVAVALMFATSVVAIVARTLLLGGGRELCRAWLFRPANALVLWLGGVRLDLAAFRAAPGPAIYLFNHSSSIDTFLVLALPIRDARYLLSTDVAAALPHTLAAWLMGTHLIAPRERAQRRRADFARVTRAWRASGSSAVVSPEGERVTTGSLGPFNPEVFQLAADLGLDLVPVFLGIPHERNPWRSFSVRPPLVVSVRALPAIDGRDPERARQEAHDALRAAHEAFHTGAARALPGELEGSSALRPQEVIS